MRRNMSFFIIKDMFAIILILVFLIVGCATVKKELEKYYQQPEAVPPTTPARGLIAHYAFDGDVKDMSGSNLHGTKYGDSKYVEGVIEQALMLGVSRSKEYVTLPNSLSSNEYSISLWIKFNDFPETNFSIFMLNSTQRWQGSDFWLFTHPKNVIKLAVLQAKADLRGQAAFNNSDRLNTQEVYHVVCTYKDNLLRLYVNGNLYAEYSQVRPIPATSSNIVIGVSPNGTGFYQLRGWVDDLRIYDQALSVDKINELFLSGKKQLEQVSDTKTGIISKMGDTTDIVKIVGDGAYPVWSPNGKKISFLAYGGEDMDGGDIFHLGIMNSDGSERNVFEDVYMADFKPQFSPTGERLLYPDLMEGGMRWMDLKGEGRQSIEQKTFKTSLSPGSQKKVSIETQPHDNMPDYNYYVVKLENEEIAKVPCSIVFFNFDPYLNWSPDEKWVCSRAWEKEGPQSIWIVSTIDTTKKKVGHYSPVSWSPDSTKMAYEKDGHLWIARSDGSQPKQITTGKGYRPHPPYLSPSWSPTGEKIAFLWEKSIALVDSDGKNIQEVPGTEGAGSPPSWSPDGTKIAFHIHDWKTKQYTIKIANIK